MSSARFAAIIILFACFAVAPSSVALAQAITPPFAPEARCEYAPDGPIPAHRNVAFPDGDLFRPLLADPKEPRSSFTYLSMRVRESGDVTEGQSSDFNAGNISAGGLIGIFAHAASRCGGVQISLYGAVFSQFNLDSPSRDLINTDFIVGTQISVRTGGLSGRLRFYHQSSHLGDDFVRHNPTTGDLNFGLQAIDALVSIDHDWWRVYAGGGYLFVLSGGEDFALLQGGVELRGRRPLKMFRPVAAIDVSSLETRDWGLSTSASGGFEWTSPAASRRLRGVVVFSDGYTPFGQFAIQQRARAIGLQLQIEF